MRSPSIQKLTEQFSRFPTVGPRTAARFVFYLLKMPKDDVKKIIESFAELKNKVKFCSFCFNPFEPSGSEQGLCEICSDNGREKTLLCVVEKETDLETIEKTKKYRGRYFILGGTISKLRKEDIDSLRMKELLETAESTEISEIIIAANSTIEGEATALYIERLLKPINKKITRLGRGLPVGSELEYADEETLGSALDNRK